MNNQVLALDVAGVPKKWLSAADAVFYHAKGMVAWSMGEDVTTFRGGHSRVTGVRSAITTKSIIALTGKPFKVNFDAAPYLTNEKLFLRDRHVCAYCGDVFRERYLSRDHVHPSSRGGMDVWENVVTACVVCNNRKDNKRPEEIGMSLLYAPYTPNYFEDFILSNRNIKGDQMEFLLAKVASCSRFLM